MKKTRVLFCLLLSVHCISSSPLFFDIFKKAFRGPHNRPNTYTNNNNNAWSGGSEITKEKKFPWDIFGIFGYKNVIRPRPPIIQPQQPPVNILPQPRPPVNILPTVTGKPPYFPNPTTWPNNCNCGWSVVTSQTTGKPIVWGSPAGTAQPPFISNNNPFIASTTTARPWQTFPANSVDFSPSSNNNNNNNNDGSNFFAPAQQYVPATELHTYFPTLPASDFTTTTTSTTEITTASTVTVAQPANGFATSTPTTTTVTDTIDVFEEEDFELVTNGNFPEILATTVPPPVTVLPRQNRNQKGFKSFKQPDFSIDVFEEPSAEPLSTHGDGWIPMTIDQILKPFSTSSTTSTTTTKRPESRDPKVLKWHSNPFFIRQEPNFEAFIEAARNSGINHIKHGGIQEAEKDVIHVSDHTQAYFGGINTLATLAYVTEHVNDSSEEDIFPTSSESSIDNQILVEKPLIVDSVRSKSKKAEPRKIMDLFTTTTRTTINTEETETKGPSTTEANFFEPILTNEEQHSGNNWIWADVDSYEEYDYHEDDLRDPDMTTISSSKGTASSDVLSKDSAEYPFPTLEPGFDLLSDDWFEGETKANDLPPEVTSEKHQERATSEKFVLYYPISGTPFFSFNPKLEIASIVKKKKKK